MIIKESSRTTPFLLVLFLALAHFGHCAQTEPRSVGEPLRNEPSQITSTHEQILRAATEDACGNLKGLDAEPPQDLWSSANATLQSWWVPLEEMITENIMNRKPPLSGVDGKNIVEYMLWDHVEYTYAFHIAIAIAFIFVFMLIGMCCRCYDGKRCNWFCCCNIRRWGVVRNYGFFAVFLSVFAVALALLIPASSNAMSISNSFHHNQCSILTTASTILYGDKDAKFDGVKPVVEKMRIVKNTQQLSDFRDPVLAKIREASKPLQAAIEEFVNELTRFQEMYPWQQLSMNLAERWMFCPIAGALASAPIDMLKKVMAGNVKTMEREVDKFLASKNAKAVMEQVLKTIEEHVALASDVTGDVEQKVIQFGSYLSSTVNKQASSFNKPNPVTVDFALDFCVYMLVAFLLFVAALLIFGIFAAVKSSNRTNPSRGLSRTYFLCSIPFVVVMLTLSGAFLISSVVVTESCAVLDSNKQNPDSLLHVFVKDALRRSFRDETMEEVVRNAINTCVIGGHGSADVVDMVAPIIADLTAQQGLSGGMKFASLSENPTLKQLIGDPKATSILLWLGPMGHRPKFTKDSEVNDPHRLENVVQHWSPSLSKSETVVLPTTTAVLAGIKPDSKESDRVTVGSSEQFDQIAPKHAQAQLTAQYKKHAVDVAQKEFIFFNEHGQANYKEYKKFVTRKVLKFKGMVEKIDIMLPELVKVVEKQIIVLLTESFSPLNVVDGSDCRFIGKGVQEIQNAACHGLAPAMYNLSGYMFIAALLMLLSALLMFFWWCQLRSVKRWEQKTARSAEDANDMAPLLRPDSPHTGFSSTPSTPVVTTQADPDLTA